MNFKKYHVSRNLWDGNKIENCAFQTGIYTTPTYSPRNIIYIPVVGGNTYTFSINNIASGTSFQSVCSADKPALGVSYLINESTTFITHGAVTTFTRTIPKEANWWAIQIMSLDNLSNNIMINEGSTALPYEPYSSEVWHDIPYYTHKTATDTLTLPATLYPNDTSITVGLKGNEEHTGTPSPQNPVMPNGTGERTGNLWDESYTNISTTLIYKSFYVGDGIFTASTDCPISYPSGSSSLFFIAGNVSTGASSENNLYNNRPRTVESINGYVTIAYRITGSVNPNDYNTMINSGSSPLPYEKFGIKIPISSADTTTNVYLGEVETTRRVKKLVLDGTENWTVTANKFYYITLPSYPINWLAAITSHFEVREDISATGCARFGGTASVPQNTFVFNYDNGAGGITSWKSYLATQYANGTPVTIWYVLATPTTGIVNEPIRKIGDYADTVSGISIPTTAGANTISVGTTLQPSEVSVNYKGWHPVADVHEAENGQWD